MTEAAKRALARRFCKGVMRRLRRILKRKPCRGACRSCAFAPRSDRWIGFEATVASLLEAHIKGNPFYCHADMPYDRKRGWVPHLHPSRLRKCASYEAIKRDPEFDRALKAAAEEVMV